MSSRARRRAPALSPLDAALVVTGAALVAVARAGRRSRCGRCRSPVRPSASSSSARPSVRWRGAAVADHLHGARSRRAPGLRRLDRHRRGGRASPASASSSASSSRRSSPAGSPSARGTVDPGTRLRRIRDRERRSRSCSACRTSPFVLNVVMGLELSFVADPRGRCVPVHRRRTHQGGHRGADHPGRVGAGPRGRPPQGRLTHRNSEPAETHAARGVSAGARSSRSAGQLCATAVASASCSVSVGRIQGSVSGGRGESPRLLLADERGDGALLHGGNQLDVGPTPGTSSSADCCSTNVRTTSASIWSRFSELTVV